MKNLILIWAIFYASLVQAVPPTGIKGQDGTINYSVNAIVPYQQATKQSGNNVLVETGSENILVNPGFEGLLFTGWTCAVGTCTKTTTAGQFSSGKAALSVALSAQAMNVSQSVATTSGIQKQGFARVIYRVPATMADFQVCALVDAAEQTCVPSANLILDDTFRSIEIPLIFGATSAGIKFKTTSSYTATAYFDAAVVSQGLGLQNLILDESFSAKVSVTGVVSGESKDFINGNCVITSTSIFTCSVPSTFTVTPNCQVTGNANDRISANYVLASSTATSLVFQTVDSNTAGSVAFPFSILCQKSGSDYLASSSNVYSQASSNYDWTSYGVFTADTTLFGQGTMTGVNGNTVPCKHRRNGSDLEMQCDFTGGTVAGTTGAIVLPTVNGSQLNVDTTKILRANTTAQDGVLIGQWITGGANTLGNVVTATGTSTDRVYVAGSYNNNAMMKPAAISSFVASNQSWSIFFKVPISGWSNTGSIVGSFAGTPNVPGYTGRVEDFSFSYGTTNATTVCSASPCSYLDQIGTAVSSVTRSSAGVYTMNLARTYTKLKCSGSFAIPTVSNSASTGLTCSSCNSLSFETTNSTLITDADTVGTIVCQGTY